MQITIDVINEAIQNGIKVIKSVYPRFVIPTFTSVKIGKSRTSWASISKNQDNSFKLRVSNCYEEISNSQKAKIRLESTMIHELIHTIPGCLNHGKKFKLFANLINEKYNNKYHICRCTSMTEFGINQKNKNIKYIIECSNCHNQYEYKRKPKYSSSFIHEFCWCNKCKVKKTLNLIKL